MDTHQNNVKQFSFDDGRYYVVLAIELQGNKLHAGLWISPHSSPNEYELNLSDAPGVFKELAHIPRNEASVDRIRTKLVRHLEYLTKECRLKELIPLNIYREN